MGWGYALSVAAPYIVGALSTAGSIFTNKANAAQAEKTMRFQERMSSTSAQRAMQDYKAAGLNPALAYERGASSPGGATATLSDPVASGVNSAQATRQINQAMRIAQQAHNMSQAEAVQRMATGAAHQLQAEASARKTDTERELISALQPSTVREAQANATLKTLLLPGARNTAKFEELLGTAGKGMSSARTVAEILKMLRGTFNP